VSDTTSAEFRATPSGGLEVLSAGVWTHVPQEAAAEIERLAKMLAEIVDATLLTVQDVGGTHPIELRVGSFQPDLGNRAAALLENVGY
jgi:hypothetical protein